MGGKRLRHALVAALMVATTVVAAAGPAQAGGIERDGCTPGYWKNHTESWVGYSPDDLVGDVFADAPAELAGDTLLDALNYGGGPDFLGAAMIMLRAATAAVLNGAHPDVTYRWTDTRVIEWAAIALVSYDRELTLHKGERFDRANNAGCPL